MKKVFLDTNVILDALMARQPHVVAAERIFSLAERKKLRVATSALAFSDIFYILRKELGNAGAMEALRRLRKLIMVLPTGEKVVDAALASGIADFEDALQFFTAQEHGITTLVTRNSADFPQKPIVICTPDEFLAAVTTN